MPVFDGISAAGWVLVNTSRPFAELMVDELVADLDRHRLVTVPATELSRQRWGRALPNTALLGGFAALTGRVSLEQCPDAATGGAEEVACSDSPRKDLATREVTSPRSWRGRVLRWPG